MDLGMLPLKDEKAESLQRRVIGLCAKKRRGPFISFPSWMNLLSSE
jgi:hypothetical protein